MLKLNIDSIRISLTNYQRVVMLKVIQSHVYLPIWIGPAEADSIALTLQNVEVPRPLTHDLLQSTIELLGAAIDHVVITDLDNDTFYAKIILTLPNETIELDARPSDAIALAIRTDAPIYASEEVVNKAAIQFDDEAIQENTTGISPNSPISKKEIQELSVYSKFIDTLNLDDIDSPKSNS